MGMQPALAHIQGTSPPFQRRADRVPVPDDDRLLAGLFSLRAGVGCPFKPSVSSLDSPHPAGRSERHEGGRASGAQRPPQRWISWGRLRHASRGGGRKKGFVSTWKKGIFSNPQPMGKAATL
jgi:hypothetical protein